MPYFRYQFRDSAGRLLEGTVQAPGEIEAFEALRARGIASPRIFPAANPAQVQTNVHISPPVQRIRTRKGLDKDRYFLFSQIADRLRAGLNPADTLEDMARFERSQKFKSSLLDMAHGAKEGIPLSTTMAKYVGLYPPHTVGTVLAGEEGGYLPDAFALLAEQANDAHRFKRFHWFIWLVAVNAMGVIPEIFAFRTAMVEAAKKTDLEGGVGSTGGFLTDFMSFFLHSFVPTVLAVTAAALLLRWIFGLPSLTMFRHRMGAAWPVYGRRAKFESIRYFLWNLGRVAQAGVPPHRTWSLAAGTAPNLEFRRRLIEAGTKMTESSSMSEAMFKADIFPDEYAPVLRTGEMVGSIDSTLAQLVESSKNDFGVASAQARFRSISFGCLITLIVSGIVVITLAWTMYRDLINVFVPDTGMLGPWAAWAYPLVIESLLAVTFTQE